MSIVADVRQLSPEWFTSALGRGRVLGVDVEPMNIGAMCQMVRADLKWESGASGPGSVVVKFPTTETSTLGLARAMGMYGLEVGFYRDLLPRLGPVSVPTCYAAEFDSETSLFTLVLEDLGGRARPGDVLTESTPEECALVLTELARLQAASWNDPALLELPWLAGRQRTYELFDAMPRGLEPFVKRFGHALEARQIELFEEVIPQAGSWVRSWSSPFVLQHGDLRTDNILFGSEDKAPPATFVDFQTVRLGPPGIDVAYFLGSSLSTATRRSVERELVLGYHTQLTAAGIEGFDFEHCWAAYREGAMYAVYLFCGLSSQVASSPRVDQVIADQTRRYADMALDLDAPRIAGLA
ncbi:phosphotransferase [Pseudonocardia spinosispora]|uniref:phosphotransferase n=1 Tax=Pseudonocardia spinosispora TaxID=103441 RepID=UPI0003F91A64|nr:phosphotransferase [Pseudonocardia spinosispora]